MESWLSFFLLHWIHLLDSSMGRCRGAGGERGSKCFGIFLFPYNRHLLKPAKGHCELSLTLQNTNSIYLWAAGSANAGFCQPVNFFSLNRKQSSVNKDKWLCSFSADPGAKLNRPLMVWPCFIDCSDSPVIRQMYPAVPSSLLSIRLCSFCLRCH